MNTVSFDNLALPFEKELQISLSKIHQHIDIEHNSDHSNTNYTKAVYNLLKQVAKSNGRNYSVAASKLEEKECTEWLYDLVMYDNNSHGLNNVYLVVESEWFNPRGNED